MGYYASGGGAISIPTELLPEAIRHLTKLTAEKVANGLPAIFESVYDDSAERIIALGPGTQGQHICDVLGAQGWEVVTSEFTAATEELFIINISSSEKWHDEMHEVLNELAPFIIAVERSSPSWEPEITLTGEEGAQWGITFDGERAVEIYPTIMWPIVSLHRRQAEVTAAKLYLEREAKEKGDQLVRIVNELRGDNELHKAVMKIIEDNSTKGGDQ